MVTDGEEEVVESVLEASTRETVVEGAWVELAAAVLAVVLTVLELPAVVTPPLEPVPPTRRGLSSDCWMIFTPSGLLHDDSLVLAL